MNKSQQVKITEVDLLKEEVVRLQVCEAEFSEMGQAKGGALNL